MQNSSKKKDMLLNLQNKVAQLETKLSLLSDWIVNKFADDLSVPSELKPNPQCSGSRENRRQHHDYEHDPIDTGLETTPLGIAVKEEPADENDTIHVVDIRTITNPVDDESTPSTSRSTRQPFVCNVCYRKFRTSSNLKNHEMTHCFVQMTASDSIGIGIQSSQPQSDPEPEDLSSDHEDVSHLRSDSEYEEEAELKNARQPIRRNRAAKYSCHICQKTFTSKIVAKKHLRTFHCDEVKQPTVIKTIKAPARRVFRCKICKEGTAFSSQILLNKHNADAHNIPIPLKLIIGKCEECNVTFTSYGSREQHNRSVHLKIRPFVCSECGKSFAKRDTLGRHMDLHLDGKKYGCQHCDKSFQQREGLRIHMRRHFKAENSNYQCFQCGQLFLTLQVLKIHIREVHENLRPFGCPTCEKRFKKKVHLKYHLKTHDNPNGRKRGLNKEREPLPKRKPNNQLVLPPVGHNSELDIQADQQAASDNLFLDVDPRGEAAKSALPLRVSSTSDAIFGMSSGAESNSTFYPHRAGVLDAPGSSSTATTHLSHETHGAEGFLLYHT